MERGNQRYPEVLRRTNHIVILDSRAASGNLGNPAILRQSTVSCSKAVSKEMN